MKRSQIIQYDSIMVDDNEVKTKGRICVSNESLSFERKIGFISKKFEPILKSHKKYYFQYSCRSNRNYGKN